MKKLSYLLILSSLSIATVTNATTLTCFNPEKKTYTHNFKTSANLEYDKKLKAYKIPNITDAINTCYNAGDNYIPVVNSLTSHYKLIGTYDLSHEIDNNTAQKKINDDINTKTANDSGTTLKDFEREGFSINGYELVKKGNHISKLAVITDDIVEIDIPEKLNKNEKLKLIESEFLSTIKKNTSIDNDDQAKLLTSVMLSYAHQGAFIFPTTIPIGSITTDNDNEDIQVVNPIDKHTAYKVTTFDKNYLYLDVSSIIKYPLIDAMINEKPIKTQNIKIKTHYEIAGTADKYTITGKSIKIKMLDYDPENSLQKLLAISIVDKINNYEPSK